MKRLNSTFIIYSVFFLTACGLENAKTQQVEDYLKKLHNTGFNDSTIYVFFPANQCKNCFMYGADHITNTINEHTLIITGFDSSNFKGFRHVLHDGKNSMMELEALDYGNRLITFKNGRIIKNEVITDLYAQLSSAWLELNVRNN